MPFPSVSLLHLIPPTMRSELVQFTTLLQTWLGVEHHEDGTHGDVTANSVTEGDHESANGVAVDWTPTWTNLTVGATGSDASTYEWISGDLALVRYLVTLSGAGVTGSVAVTLPFTGTVTGVARGFMLDVSAGTYYPLVGVAGSTAIAMFTGSSPIAALSNVAPFAWAASDQLYAEVLVKRA